jgi:hypothetical protein
MTPPDGAATLGLLLGLAVACGLNLYATVALLGITSRLGWIDALPVGLRGLENGLVIGSAAGLFFIEFVVDKVPYADSLWDALHTIIRPVAATLLALLVLWNEPFDVRLAGAALAGVAALVVHTSKAGLRVALSARPRTRVTAAVSLFEDVAAAAIVLVALARPSLVFAPASLLLFALLLFARGLWRAALLGVLATIARLRGFFGTPGWRPADQLPHGLVALVQGDEVGGAPSRAARAALLGVPEAGAYRNGWLLLDRGRTAFLYRSLLRAHRVELPGAASARVRGGMLTDMLDVETADQSRFTIFLLKDGPPAATALADMRPPGHTAEPVSGS